MAIGFGVACPKPERRLADKHAKRLDDVKQLEAWKRAVRLRDKMKCRVCGRKVVVTLALQVDRAECHHIVGRANRALRYDKRNGLLACHVCHLKLQRHTIRALVMPLAVFYIDGYPYINADKDLTFI